MVPKRMTVDAAISTLRDSGYDIEHDQKYIYIRVPGGIGVDKLWIENGLAARLVSAKQVKSFVKRVDKPKAAPRPLHNTDHIKSRHRAARILVKYISGDDFNLSEKEFLRVVADRINDDLKE